MLGSVGHPFVHPGVLFAHKDFAIRGLETEKAPEPLWNLDASAWSSDVTVLLATSPPASVEFRTPRVIEALPSRIL